MPTYSSSYSDTSSWSMTYIYNGHSNNKVYKIMDDYQQLYDHCEPKKKKVMSKKNSDPDLGKNLEKKYEEMKDRELVKLLESLNIPKEGIATPIIVLVPQGKEGKSAGFFETVAIQKKHPAVIKIVTVMEEELEDIEKLEKMIAKNFIVDTQFNKLSPTVVMIDVFNKDQDTMEQSLLMKSGALLIDTFQKVLARMKRKKKAEIVAEPLIIISDPLDLDDIEEAAMVANVSEMEEVKEDNLSYIKLTF